MASDSDAGAGGALSRGARQAFLLLCALAFLPALSAPGSGFAPAAPQEGPLGVDAQQVIARWTERYQRFGRELDPDSDGCLGPALEALRKRLAVVDGSENETLIVLCDLASVAARSDADSIARGRFVADDREARARAGARGVLRAALDAPSGAGRGHWLATNVLAAGDAHPVPRRIAVAEALRGRHWETTLLALFTAAGAPQRGLREAAVRALGGWKSDAVDRFLANATLRALRERDFLDTTPLLEHFAARKFPSDHPIAVQLAAALGVAASSADWRAAVSRLPMTRILPDELALPLLIESLGLWARRGATGVSSRRVEGAIVAELELRSHVKLGMSAERWSYWWKTTRLAAAGTTPPPGPDGQAARTQASFFGLRPWTDRVVFVIDRSGSMTATFGTSSASRYAEALRQLENLLLELGPRTRFNVILFSDEARAWGAGLRPATASGVAGALQWARAFPPVGGTHIGPGIRRALELDPRTGRLDLERLEVDTVIVLCDGATEEGPAWAKELLRTVAEPACVRFDCVQIGGSGNGTLEALAAESGGQFVRVDS
jgi:hypothetical protein